MARKRGVITLSLSTHEKTALESIALELGCTWGEKPNISRLIQAIAEGEFTVIPTVEPPPELNKQERLKVSFAAIKHGLDEVAAMIADFEEIKNEDSRNR